MEEITFTRMTEVGHEKRPNAILQKFLNGSSEPYYVWVIGNTELSIFNAKHLIIPKAL